MSNITYAGNKPFQESAAALPHGMRVKASTRNIAGMRFGRLLVLNVVGKNKQNSLMWLCQCDCGKMIERSSASLRKAKGICSCGCYLKEFSRERLKQATTWNVGTSYTIKSEFKSKQAWAKAVIREHGAGCEKCGWSEARCDVHHKIPVSVGGKHTIENGIVLCPNCHRVEHESGRDD